MHKAIEPVSCLSLSQVLMADCLRFAAQAIEPVVLATEPEPEHVAPPVPAPKPQQPSADLLTPSAGETPLIDI